MSLKSPCEVKNVWAYHVVLLLFFLHLGISLLFMSLRLCLLYIFLLCTVPVISQYTRNDVDKYALEADSFDVEARKYMLKRKPDSAKILLDKALTLSKQSGNATILARCYIDYSGFYLLQGKYNLAKEYIDMAWPYLNQTEHYDVKISGILQRANYYNIVGRKDSSIYYYRTAEEYNTKTDPYRNWTVYMALGELFNQADDTLQAVKYLRKAYLLTGHRENKPDHLYLLTVFINYYMSRNKTDGAGELIAEYNKLIENRKKTPGADPMQDLVLSLTNFRLEDNVEFMKGVKESLLKDGNLLQAMIINGYIITYYEKRKDYETALGYATEGEEMAARTGGLQDIFGARKMKYDLLQKAGHYKEANVAAEDLFSLKDSILTMQRREQIYELEKKYESEKREKEIELLVSQNDLDYKTIALLQKDKKITALLLQQEMSMSGALTRENQLKDSIVKSEKAYSLSVVKEREQQSALNNALDRENKLKASQLGRERTTKWILGGGAVMILASGIFALSLYRRQKKKSNIIQKQANDLEVLMKEIHHRVKNNLQIVSSLLDLQRHTITDQQASEAVKEGKNRVQSMALIHQNLYAEGNIKAIQVKEYVANLLKNLCDSYNITSEKVNISSDIDNLNLDIDTMIPLGLVLNELVTNSLKYAFPDGHAGKLSVVLKEEQECLLLKVSDNGQGYPGEFDIHSSKSFGMKMIKAFAQKLKARLDIYNDNGAVAEMRITKYNIA